MNTIKFKYMLENNIMFFKVTTVKLQLKLLGKRDIPLKRIMF